MASGPDFPSRLAQYVPNAIRKTVVPSPGLRKGTHYTVNFTASLISTSKTELYRQVDTEMQLKQRSFETGAQ